MGFAAGVAFCTSREVMRAVLRVPTTYAEWSACLELFEAGGDDDAALHAMSSGSLSWTGGVAPMFARRISDVLNARLKRISDDMTRELRFGTDTSALARTMLDARKKLGQLNRLASLSVFAEELRQGLEQQIAHYAKTAQSSLEDSAKHDRSGQLANTIRQCSLLTFSAHTVAVSEHPSRNGTSAGPAPAPASVSASGFVRRRNILT
ncbi:hypothetical protein [Paraburkholderia tropica]|uniref:hypothetical protein n=1 Tax=Paraburkholderia tropica TaxID=92647 RepID=UPI00159269C5|nr:hypothetical protein [Paraburkholderia tropica]